MKKNDLTDTKALDIKTLRAKSKDLKDGISEMVLQKNMNSLKDTKSIHKSRKDLAQVLTILKQKELLEMLGQESGVESTESSKVQKGAAK